MTTPIETKFNNCEPMFKKDNKEIRADNNFYYVKDLSTSKIKTFEHIVSALEYFENNLK